MQGSSSRRAASLVSRAGHRLRTVFRCIFVLHCIEVVVFALQGDLLSAVDFTDAEAEANDRRVTIVSWSQSAFRILVVVPFFLRWAYLVQSETCRRFLNCKYYPGWTCWSFFVPFANLFIPYRALKQVRDRFGVRGQGYFDLWWLSFLFSGVLSAMGRRQMLRAQYLGTLDDMVSANMLFIISSALAALSAWLAVSVVRSMTDAVVAFDDAQGAAAASDDSSLGPGGSSLMDEEGSGKYEA